MNNLSWLAAKEDRRHDDTGVNHRSAHLLRLACPVCGDFPIYINSSQSLFSSCPTASFEDIAPLPLAFDIAACSLADKLRTRSRFLLGDFVDLLEKILSERDVNGAHRLSPRIVYMQSSHIVRIFLLRLVWARHVHASTRSPHRIKECQTAFMDEPYTEQGRPTAPAAQSPRQTACPRTKDQLKGPASANCWNAFLAIAPSLLDRKDRPFDFHCLNVSLHRCNKSALILRVTNIFDLSPFVISQ